MQKYRLGKQLNRDSHLRENSKDGLGEHSEFLSIIATHSASISLSISTLSRCITPDNCNLEVAKLATLQ